MLLIFFIIILATGVVILVGFIKGIIFGLRDGWNDINIFEPLETIPEPKELPYYIDEQIKAIYNQLEANHSLIDLYREQSHYTSDINKRVVLNKRISDLEYKCGKLEEKVYKLLEKWEE